MTCHCFKSVAYFTVHLTLQFLCINFQLHIGNALEFYVGQMQYVSDDEPDLGVILGSSAGALSVVIFAVVVTAMVCWKSRRCRSCVSRQKPQSSARTAAINEGFLDAMPFPKMKRDRDTLFIGQTGVSGRNVDTYGSRDNIAFPFVSDMYLTPVGMQQYDNRGWYRAPVGGQRNNWNP